jgi:hypothetical protein
MGSGAAPLFKRHSATICNEQFPDSRKGKEAGLFCFGNKNGGGFIPPKKPVSFHGSWGKWTNLFGAQCSKMLQLFLFSVFLKWITP